ncbi:hypothetical protein OEZ83_25925 [Leclercia adecarboxylata]|uniref:hypothetical protein n=1 Tax=Leclercia adecarboxylata TaxID=83655 RepID=UPI00234DBE89|nr:hypothetical protein [Leclercia adecarboxylata]MDC6705807.1 hypothetical protein [Leclercia adecarboxylata]
MWLRENYKPDIKSDGQLYKNVKFATDVTADVLRKQREQEAAVHEWDMDVQKRGSAQKGANVIENSILKIDRIAQGMGAVSTDVSRRNNQSESIYGMVETIRKFAMT